MVENIQTLSIDKIINFRDNLNNDLNHLNLILDKTYKKYKIINNFETKIIQIVNDLEKENIEECLTLQITEKINAASKLLTSKNCKSEDLKKTYINYINYIIYYHY